MISVDGAALLAQVIPIGLLILAVDRRMLGPTPYPSGIAGQVLWWATYLGIGLTAAAGVLAVAYCVIAVSRGEGLRDESAAIVAVAAVAVAFVVAGDIVSMTMRGYSGRNPRSPESDSMMSEASPPAVD